MSRDRTVSANPGFDWGRAIQALVVLTVAIALTGIVCTALGYQSIGFITFPTAVSFGGVTLLFAFLSN